MDEQELNIKSNLDNKDRAYATGRRKNSIARVWLKRGNGEIKINGKLIDKYFKDLEKMGKVWEDPWEKPLHNIYKSHPCLSPIPSLAIHCTNINSVFGLSPFIDIKKLWENNRI